MLVLYGIREIDTICLNARRGGHSKCLAKPTWNKLSDKENFCDGERRSESQTIRFCSPLTSLSFTTAGQDVTA